MSGSVTGLRAGVACGSLLAAAVLAQAGVAQGVVKPAGTLVSTGSNGFGQLGDPGVTQRSVAGPVDGLSDVVEMHSGREHGVAVTAGGDVYTWGSDQNGQLGRAGTGSAAAQVTGLPDVTSVTTGHYHTLALASDGSIWAWGLNTSGQLGDGTTTTRTTPVRVSGITDAVGLAAGRDMSYAIVSGGQVRAWGLNGDGQLGDGTLTTRTTPVAVTSGLSGVTHLAGGRDHALARRSDGSLWAWGWNAYGQVGDGTVTDRTSPVPVIGSGVAEVAAGAHHSVALLADGRVRSWGRDYRGQLGDDASLVDRRSPVTVAGVSTAVSVGAGRDHGIAVLEDGSAMAWGDNPSGQLGDGTLTRRPTPVTMDGVASAVAASGGQAHTFVHLSGGGGNQPPTARITTTCADLTCEVDSAGSSDDQGVTGYAWDFGDGENAAGATASHTYSQQGPYTVTLTVTDAEGLQDTASAEVWAGSSPVTFRAASQRSTTATQTTITVPATVQAGDRLLVVVSTALDVAASMPAGWVQRGAALDGDLRSRVFEATAISSSAGSAVPVTLGARTKVSLVLAAYDEVTTVGAPVSAVRSGTSATMRTPSLTLGIQPGWIVSYWVDKSSGNTGWSVPATTTPRIASIGAGSPRVTAALADRGPTSGTWTGATATSTSSSGKAVAWSILLR